MFNLGFNAEKLFTGSSFVALKHSKIRFILDFSFILRAGFVWMSKVDGGVSGFNAEKCVTYSQRSNVNALEDKIRS